MSLNPNIASKGGSSLLPKRYFFYISGHYLKKFLILIFSLSIAVVFIDYLQHSQKLHVGLNRKILYIFYTWEYTLALVYPLVILMALAWTQISFIYNNVFVSLFSFGYGSRRLLLPFLTSAMGIYLLFISLQTTSFAYGKDRAMDILNADKPKEKLIDLFFKYDNSFVYAKELDPLRKTLKKVTIFEMKNRQVLKIIQFPKAYYINGVWIAHKVQIRRKIFNKKGHFISYRDRYINSLKVLQGYQPKIFRKIYEGGTFSLRDSFEALNLLERQGLSSNRVKANFYHKLVTPIFALALLVILFYKSPSYHRFVRKEKLLVILLGSSIFTWALLFSIYRLGINGVVPPDWGQIIPILILAIYAFILDIKELRKISI